MYRHDDEHEDGTLVTKQGKDFSLIPGVGHHDDDARRKISLLISLS